MNHKFIKVFFVVLLVFSACTQQKSNNLNNDVEKPKNIILLIGDGMGVAQLCAGMTVSDHPFAVEKFPFSGLCKTSSAEKYITDSGAAATAIACGTKTKNEMIGEGPDSLPLTSIMEFAHKNGLSTGLVSTAAITHATPASFVAHNSNRNNYEEIASDFMSGTIDVFLGGGKDHFKSREDGTDLTDTLKEQGYEIIYSVDSLNNTNSDKIAGLLADVHMPRVLDGRGDALKIMTGKAIETLSRNKNGFVLMVEGSMIDWGGHQQDIDFIVSETIDFDKAVSVAIEFAEKEKNTLVIVTADHETGGLALTGGSLNEHKITTSFAGGVHTAVMVPIFAFGPGADKFSGIHDNTFFINEFLTLLSIEK